MLERIAGAAGVWRWLRALIVVGSMASNTADAVSDVDLLVIAREGTFDVAWEQRRQLEATGALCSWDQRPDESEEVAAHRWLTPDLVLVEALVATPRSGVRLAQPWRLIMGDLEVPGALVSRPPINRSEMGDRESHPIERAYDEFKRRIRNACSQAIADSVRSPSEASDL